MRDDLPVTRWLAACLLVVMAAAAAGASDPAALLATARAARDSGRYAEAERLAREGLAMSDDPVWPLTLALILADQKRSADALAVLAAAPPGRLPELERLLAKGYAHQRGGDDFAALRAYGEALRLAPDNAEARRAVAGLLDRQRAPFGAAALGGLDAEREADQAAALTRWGAEVRPADIARRFEGTDRALAALDALLAKLAADPAADPALVRRVKLDRLVALRDRERMAEVVLEADALAAAGPLPPYAEQARADALLHERQPEAALAAYDRVLAAEPDNIQGRYGRVFALVESEQLSEAIRAADSIAASRPAFTAFAGGPATTPDSEYTYAQQLAAEVRLWSNLIAAGAGRVTALAEAAPAHAGLRRSQVGAFGARGWPRAAEAEARIAASLDPESLATRLLLAETDLSRHRLPQAATAADALLALAPENVRVQRFAREVAAARGWGLEAEVMPTFNNGGGLNGLGREWAASARLETPDLGQGLRLFALADFARATPPEGTVTRNRAGGGVALRGADVAASLYATGSWGTLARAGAGATLSWEASDRLTLGVDAELFSRQTPLRALTYGIHADSVSGSVGWRRDERLSLSLSGGWLGFSDGNDRLSGGLSLTAQLLAVPHFDLSARADLYASRNSRPGGPYFSPRSDWSISGGLFGQHVTWRRYERSFVQAFSVEFGRYDQQAFAADWIALARYEHRWRRDPWTEFTYGITLDRRVYDGAPERGIALSAGLRQRF
jgi:biofilm PGA synthesis protein PgaA